jgi:translation elongation factor P/translation initiation factor 5A
MDQNKVKYENSACNVLRLPKTKTHQKMASATTEKKNLQYSYTKDDLEEGTP